MAFGIVAAVSAVGRRLLAQFDIFLVIVGIVKRVWSMYPLIEMLDIELALCLNYLSFASSQHVSQYIEVDVDHTALEFVSERK